MLGAINSAQASKMASQPAPPSHYRQEVIRLRAEEVDFVSRHAHMASIPIQWNMEMHKLVEVRNILNDSAWEVVTADADWVWFKRYMVGEYAK